MGENANSKWEWHNTSVGSGYQALGVVRQQSYGSEKMKIIDMRGPISTTESKPSHNQVLNAPPNSLKETSSSTNEDKSLKEKKENKKVKKEKKDKKEKKEKKDKKDKKNKKDKKEKDRKIKKEEKKGEKEKEKGKGKRKNDDEKSGSDKKRNKIGSDNSMINERVVGFNPLLQLLATRLSDTTRQF